MAFIEYKDRDISGEIALKKVRFLQVLAVRVGTENVSDNYTIKMMIKSIVRSFFSRKDEENYGGMEKRKKCKHRDLDGKVLKLTKMKHHCVF